MSDPCDDLSDMGRFGHLDDELTEAILRGQVDVVPDDDRAVTELVASLRANPAPAPAPNADMLHVFAAGVPADAGGTPAAPMVTTRRRMPAVIADGRNVVKRTLVRVAGLSLAVKLTIGVAAAAAAVGGAGAAGLLPGQADAELPASADFGQEVAEEATTNQGVDGQDVADRARELRGDRGNGAAGTGDGNADQRGLDARDARGDNAQRGLDEAGERTERAPSSVPQSGDDGGALAEERVNDTPAADAPTDPPVGPDAGLDTADDASDGRASDGQGRR